MLQSSLFLGLYPKNLRIENEVLRLKWKSLHVGMLCAREFTLVEPCCVKPGAKAHRDTGNVMCMHQKSDCYKLMKTHWVYARMTMIRSTVLLTCSKFMFEKWGCLLGWLHDPLKSDNCWFLLPPLVALALGDTLKLWTGKGPYLPLGSSIFPAWEGGVRKGLGFQQNVVNALTVYLCHI